MEILSGYIDTPEQEIPEHLITFYHRFFMIISLKGCLFSMVQTILNWKTSHNSFEKISLCLKTVVDEILKILNKKEDNDKHKVFIREVATDFFATLLDDAN
jgi:amino acid permease